MCGKALPDLVKQPKTAGSTSGSPTMSSTSGVASRAVMPPPSAPPARPVTPTPAPAARPDNPNRDLSYLLHDDHVPARTSRVPFIVGGLVLAAVAAVFVMRGC